MPWGGRVTAPGMVLATPTVKTSLGEVTPTKAREGRGREGRGREGRGREGRGREGRGREGRGREGRGRKGTDNCLMGAAKG